MYRFLPVAVVLLLTCVFLTPALATTPCPTTPIPRATPAPQFHCGVEGRVDSGYRQRFISPSRDQKSCYDACLADSKCLAFGFDTISVLCYTFSKTLDEKHYLYDPTTHVFYWNLRGCYYIPSGCSTTGATPTPTTPVCTPAVNAIQNPGFDYSTRGRCKVWSTDPNMGCVPGSTPGSAILQTNIKSNDGYVLSQPLSSTIKSGLTDTSNYTVALQYQFFPPPNKTDSTGFISFQYLDPHGKYTDIGYLEDLPDGKWHQYRNTFNGFPSDTNSSLVIVVQVSLDQSQPVHGGIANLDNVTLSKTPDPRCPKS